MSLQRVWSGLVRACSFWICGSWSWLLLLCLELNADRPDATQLLSRALYVTQLACRYSALALVPLAVLHGLRQVALRKLQRPDLWLTALVTVLLAPLCYREAELLSSGSMLLETARALPLRWAMFAVLLIANVSLWHVHLALCCAPEHRARRWLVMRLPRLQRRGPQLMAAGAWFLAGCAILVVFSDQVDHGLRAYVFFSQFLMPSAWLFGASLLYGLWLRVGLRWPLAAAGVLLLLELAAGETPALASDVHRAHSGYERRGGLIALTDLSSSIQRGARYATLDVSHPERFQCRLPPPPSAASSRTAAELLGHRNVILISVDTLRKDALQMNDDAGKPITPNLRNIQAQSLSFERAVTTYPATLFALGSALTGQSPSEVMFAPKQPDNLFTQTRALFQDTLIAFPSVGWFKRPPVPQLLTQSTPPAYFANAERSTTWLLQRLRESRTRKHRVFAWIHYFEPHTSKSVGRGQRAVQTARVSYGDLVHEVDAQIGRLWGELERLTYLRDSLVIVFSDHGEALGEFGYFGHHVYLNHFATDVPLLVHRPHAPPAKTDAQALLSDIAPTVRAWLGLPAQPGNARDLLALAADGGERYAMSEAFPVRGRALYDVARMPITSPTALLERMRLLRTAAIDYQPKVSLVSAQYRLIVNRVTGAEEFYDRVRDPGEQNDLAPDNLPEYARMRSALATQMRALSERIYCGVQHTGH